MESKRKCIWCGKASTNTAFNKEAHIVPQSLGGKLVCENVCDDCNAYFGNATSAGPSVETAIKETFFVSRCGLLAASGQIGKNKAWSRPASMYFNINFKESKLSMKPAYLMKRGLQSYLGRQLKRGLYKMFLEEYERTFGNASSERFDFIRRFARYNLDDLPALYYVRRYGVILTATDEFTKPRIVLSEDERNKTYLSDFGFHDFELLGHVFAIATTSLWEMQYEKFLHETELSKAQFFKSIKHIKRLDDVDILMKFMK